MPRRPQPRKAHQTSKRIRYRLPRLPYLHDQEPVGLETIRRPISPESYRLFRQIGSVLNVVFGDAFIPAEFEEAGLGVIHRKELWKLKHRANGKLKHAPNAIIRSFVMKDMLPTSAHETTWIALGKLVLVPASPIENHLLATVRGADSIVYEHDTTLENLDAYLGKRQEWPGFVPLLTLGTVNLLASQERQQEFRDARYQFANRQTYLSPAQ